MLDPKNNAMLAEPSLIANRILFLEAKGYFQQVNIFLNDSFEMNVHFGEAYEKHDIPNIFH